MQKKVHTILLFLFLANTKLCTASTPLDWDANFTVLNTQADSIVDMSAKQEDKKLYWGFGTTTLGYENSWFRFAFGGYVMQTFDGFIGYNISNRLSVENQLSYYQGDVTNGMYVSFVSFSSTSRFVSNNIRIKTKPFNRLPLFVGIGYKSEFNLYFQRSAYDDIQGSKVEAVIINNKLRYWNSFYSFFIDYTIVNRKKYSIDLLLPINFSNYSLGNRYTGNFYRHRTALLNYGIGLHVKF